MSEGALALHIILGGIGAGILVFVFSTWAYFSGIKAGKHDRDGEWNSWCDHMKRIGKLAQDVQAGTRRFNIATPPDRRGELPDFCTRAPNPPPKAP